MRAKDKNERFGRSDRDLDPRARQEQSRARAERIRLLLQSTRRPAPPTQLLRPGISTATPIRYSTTADPTNWMSVDAGRPLIEAAFDSVKDAADRAVIAWPSKPGGAFVPACIFLREARASGRLAHATVGYWPWREGALRAARSILVNPDDIARASLVAYNDTKKTEWQTDTLAHQSLCLLEMRLRDLVKSRPSSATVASVKSIVVRSPTLLETTSVFAPDRKRGANAHRSAPDQILRRVRKYTSMGEPNAGLVEHLDAIGDPTRAPFVLLGLPAVQVAEGLTRYYGCQRILRHGLDLVVADLTRIGRSEIQDDWERRFETLLTALDGIDGRRPGVVVVTEESFIHRRAYRLLKNHAEMRRPKVKAQQLGLYLESATLLGAAPDTPTELPPISFQADIKDASLAPLRKELVALGRRMREEGAPRAAESVSRVLAFIRRCASLPLALTDARDIADIIYDEDEEFDEALRAMFRPKMVLSDLIAAGDLHPVFAGDIKVAVRKVEAKVSGWEKDTPVAAKLAELLAKPEMDSPRTTVSLADRRIAEVFLASDQAVNYRCSVVDHRGLAIHLAAAAPERLVVVGPTPEAVQALLTTKCGLKTCYLLGDAAGSALLSAELSSIEAISAFSAFAARAKMLVAALRRGGSDEALDHAEAEFSVASVIKERAVDLTQADEAYRGEVIQLTMQSGLRLDYRPGGEILLLSPGELRPFERIHAREVQPGQRILVLDASIREPLRLAIAGSRKSQQELATYHTHIADIYTKTPGDSTTRKARNVLTRMQEIDPSTGDEINNIKRWLTADVSRTTVEGSRAPGAARDWPRFRLFMKAVGVEENLASLYWKFAVLPARSYRAQEGHLFNQRVVQFVLDPESAGIWKTMQGLWQQVMEAVDVVEDVNTVVVGGDNG
ncbi:hypothetical protein [Bradyrhizobium diazoefficiens]|uniref:hypothetical protein n=1 Tax=Bradyrhizobium diazoefficiens TaxID=1355477 RepID=UPI00272C2C95|nr:hypothetical protein [Bradyrhizobium diazoefficiens]WLA61407.1 hypothetical protein QNN01_22755 [Bradyrhizobium diazoefficiens]